MGDASAKLNPWHPMTNPVSLKHLEKLGEEVNELGTAIFRCLMQGIDECEPVTHKVNREWLEDEIADVLANSELVMTYFGLDFTRIRKRADVKKRRLIEWHKMA